MARSASQWAPGAARRWVLGVTVLALVWVLGVPMPVSAATAESDLVWILETETVPEDLYALGNEVRIDGRIEGDLLAAAADRLVVTGVVTGSVIALSPLVVIEGEVGGSMVAAAVEVDITGRVGGDVVTAAFGLQLGGQVGRDLLAAGWYASHQGEVQRDLRGMFRVLHLGGTVTEDVEVRADQLQATRGLSVQGDLDYGVREVLGQDHLQAGVSGSLINRKVLGPNIRIRAFRLMAYLLASLVVTAGGLLMLRWCPAWVEAATGRVARKPWLSLGRGLALMLSPMVGLGMVGMIVVWVSLYIWGPLLVGGLPFLTIGLGLWLVLLWASHVPVAVVTGRGVGRLLGRVWDPAWSYLVGVVIYLVVLQIPGVGLPAVIIMSMLGAGSWLGRNNERDAVQRPPAPPIRRVRLAHLSRDGPSQ